MKRSRDNGKSTLTTYGNASHVIQGNRNVISQTFVNAAAGLASNILDELTDPVELDFQGFDTLALGRLFCVLQSNRVPISEHTILVRGRDNRNGRSVSMVAKCASGLIDGYVRTIFASDNDSGDLSDIGGSNATKERIAADKVTVYLEKRVFDALPTSCSYLRIYASSRTLPRSCDLAVLASRHQIEAAVTMAKLLADYRSVDLLLTYLGSEFPAGIMELICEAFRSLSRPCAVDEKLAVRVTLSLTNYINRHMTIPEYSLSVIYAIESLGYVAPVHATTRALFCDFINSLLHQDSHCHFHRQLVWACLVAVKRSPSSNLDMGLIEGFGEASFDFDGPLHLLVREIADQRLKPPYRLGNS